MTTSEKVREIPEPLTVHEIRMEDGAAIILRRHGNPVDPRLVLSRGYGLASRFPIFGQTHSVSRRSVAP